MLTTASIIGREFDFKLLIGLIEEGVEDRVLEAVEEALAARVIEEPAGTMDRYQFSHALIQETLAQELSTTRRVRLHARIAEGLEELYGEDAAELAHHFVEAQTSTGVTKLVRYSLMAGEQALAAYAWDEALTHFERGLMAREIALSGTEAAPDREAADLLYGLGRAQATTFERHQRHQAVALLSRAFDYYAGIGDVPRAVDVAETPMFAIIGEGMGLTQIINRSLKLVPTDSHEAGRLRARQGLLLGLDEGDYDAAKEAFSRALTTAQSHGDVALELRTMANATQVNNHHSRHQEAIENGLRAIELARRIDDLRHEATARYYTLWALASVGALAEARRQALPLLDLAERLRDRQLLTTAYYANQRICRNEGAWDSARDYIDRGLASMPMENRLLGSRTLLEYEVGDFDQGRIYLDRFLETVRLNSPGPTVPYAAMASTLSIIARITGVTDWFDIAEEGAAAVLSSPSAAPNIVEVARAGLAFIAVQRGDAAAAEEQYGHLESRRGVLSTSATAGRLLGLLSQTMGNPDQASIHFEDALALCREGGYGPELAWTCCDYADLLTERDATGDRTQAIRLLEESLLLSSELGMRPLKERVTERLERIQAQPEVVPAYPDGLTEREEEVLRLLAGGKTNLQIAEALVIAEGTARRHVANIYEKIGAANRAEAAIYASRNDLLDAS